MSCAYLLSRVRVTLPCCYCDTRLWLAALYGPCTSPLSTHVQRVRTVERIRAMSLTSPTCGPLGMNGNSLFTRLYSIVDHDGDDDDGDIL